MHELFKSPTKQSVAYLKSIKVRFQRMDKTIASFFNEKSISFNFADSSNFARMMSMRFAKQNPSQSCTNSNLGSSLTKHTGQLSNLQLWFLLFLKVWSNWPPLNTRPSSGAYMHTAQGGAAAETMWHSCGDSCMRIVPGPGQARGAEAQRLSFLPEARGEGPCSAPWRAPANPDGDCHCHCGIPGPAHCASAQSLAAPSLRVLCCPACSCCLPGSGCSHDHYSAACRWVPETHQQAGNSWHGGQWQGPWSQWLGQLLCFTGSLAPVALQRTASASYAG